MSGRYKLVGRSEAGELAELFQATRDDGARVAIKLFNPRTSDPAYAQTLAAAVKPLESVTDPRVYRWLDLGVVKGRVALVRRDLDGLSLAESLRRLVTREVILPFAVSMLMIIELIEATEAGHAAGVVHGAISTGSALLGRDGSIGLSDFGATAALQAVPAMKPFLKARDPYRAPEVAKNEAPTIQSDIYSLGAVAYELLTRREPAVGNSGMSTRRDSLPPPSRVDRRLNARIDPIVMRALDPSPPRRFRECSEMADQLRKYLANNGGAPPKEEIGRFITELSRDGGPQLGQVPFSEEFTLTPIDGAQISDDEGVPALSEQQLAPAPRALAEDEDVSTSPDAESIASVPVDRTDPDQQAPAMEGWDAPPGAAPGKPGESWIAPPGAAPPKPRRSMVSMPAAGAKVPRNSRVRVIEDFATVGESSGEPEPEPPVDEQAAKATRIMTPVSGAPVILEPVERRHSDLDEPRLVLPRRKGLIVAAAVIAVIGLLLLAGSIWWTQRKAEEERARQAAAPLPPTSESVARLDGALQKYLEERHQPGSGKGTPSDSAAAEEPLAPGDTLDKPPPKGQAAFVTILSNTPAIVFIDGNRVKKHTPLVKYPVKPGERDFVIESLETKERHPFSLSFKKGQLRKIEEEFVTVH